MKERVLRRKIKDNKYALGLAGGLVGVLAYSGCLHEIELPLSTAFYKKGERITVVDDRLTTRIARAYYSKDADNYFIFYNPGKMRTIHPDAQRFVFFHEIGHIQLNHIGKEVYASKKERLRNEMEADCYAGTTLRDVYHYTPEQFERVYNFMHQYVRHLDREEALKGCVGGN